VPARWNRSRKISALVFDPINVASSSIRIHIAYDRIVKQHDNHGSETRADDGGRSYS
jgi:intergrase/recombinase